MRCRLCYRNSERGPTPTAFNSHSRPTHGSSHATHKALVHFVRFRYIYAGSLLVFLLGTAVISLIHFRPPQLQKPFSVSFFF
ncbi:unnamed protein product [Dicrocoelium dendriticum]|nr:unnamed protein product [Dicrocoelium dendriticum]